MPRAVILTALSVEYLAVRAHLDELREEVHSQGTVYERGRFLAEGQCWEVGIVEVGAGNPGSAVEAERAIAYFSPDVIFFVGVAGGIKDVRIGDVVAATEVYSYEFGKAGETFQTRPKSRDADYGLEQRARAEARKGDWLKRLARVSDPAPGVFVSPIAAGEKVIASRQSEVFQLLRSHYEDAIAVEMEGFGFLSVVRGHKQVDAIVIRGISDLIDGKEEADRGGLQEMAACHASAFAFQMLSKLKFSTKQETELSTQRGGVMNQKNSDYAKGWQTVVEGGTAYIGEIHLHGPLPQVPALSPPLPAAVSNVKARVGEIEVFFSYAHEDEALRDKLATHLKTLQRQGIIRQWHDRQIGAGKEWAGEIDRHLESAQIILLLVSADFIASDYCFDKEVKRSMERHRDGTARVIPVILRAVDLDEVPFNQLQSLPRDRTPVTSWRNQDEAFTDIAKGIRAVVKEIIEV
jgi:nucleoside phosphorylase